MPKSTLKTPLGHVTIHTDQDTLISLSFTKDPLSPTGDPFITQIKSELTQWFQNPVFSFTFPITATGTPFQKKVWAALQQIPCGETRTYSDLAKQLATSARAIGNACRANPIAIVIPCHRIVAKTGMGGYAGAISGENVQIKSRLLHLERRGSS